MIRDDIKRRRRGWRSVNLDHVLHLVLRHTFDERKIPRYREPDGVRRVVFRRIPFPSKVQVHNDAKVTRTIFASLNVEIYFKGADDGSWLLLIVILRFLFLDGG